MILTTGEDVRGSSHSSRMSKVRRSSTGPELAIRQELFRRGHRYRIDYRLPGLRTRADLAFPRERLAIYVDGCFWHRCPIHSTSPLTNALWWEAKLHDNEQRDRKIVDGAASAGWVVRRYWSHEDPIAVASAICSLRETLTGILCRH